MPFQIIRNDITKVHADAIVNTANPNPVIGGGTDSAVYRAAGEKELLAKRQEIGRIARGDAAVTPAFHLPAKYIIHTVGPVWQDGSHGEPELLRSCYTKSMDMAARMGCHSMAFPLISSGTYGMPEETALRIAVSTITGEIIKYDDLLVYLVIFSEHSVNLARKIFGNVESHIDADYVRAAREAEYALFSMQDELRRERYKDQKQSVLKDARKVERSPSKNARKADPAVSEAPRKAKPFISEAPRKIEQFISKGSRKPEPYFSESILESVQPVSECIKTKENPEDALCRLSLTFHDKFYELVNESHLTNKEIYTRANLTRQHFSKILNNESYKPRKRTVLALCIALHLNLEESEDLLSRAEWAFNPSNGTDLVVRTFIKNKQYNLNDINLFLFEHDLEQLGME